MLRHIVAFTAKNKADIPAIMQGLSLLAQIEQAHGLTVTENLKLDTLSPHPMDVVLYAEFASTAELQQFKDHPIYRQCIEVVRPLRDQRLVLDFIPTKSD